jgi:hypothetical protein
MPLVAWRRFTHAAAACLRWKSAVRGCVASRDHGSGVLGQERQALSAIALCQWRPGPEAQARVAKFLRNAPESPLADRVRLACERASGVTK